MIAWMKQRPGVILLTATIMLIVLASTLAYLHVLPRFVAEIPYFDKVLHFSIFGTLTLAILLTWGDRRFKLGPLSLPLAVFIPLAFAGLEEALQGLSPYRSLDIWDFICDAAGMSLGWLLGHRLAAVKRLTPEPSPLPASVP